MSNIGLIFLIMFIISSASIFVFFKAKRLIYLKKTSGIDLFQTRATISSIFGRRDFDKSDIEDLKTALIASDVGPDTAIKLLKSIDNIHNSDAAKNTLAENMINILGTMHHDNFSPPDGNVPKTILVVGVNGVGKTTTIAKLAYKYIKAENTVELVAADTFRAAAVEQLQTWGKRLGCDIVSQKAGADPASVVFDGLERAKTKNMDVVIVDTAGRIHTKNNLMDELKKICRVMKKSISNAPDETILILDATVGLNGLAQAKAFKESVDVTSVFLAKMDGTAKGGIALAIADELDVPISYIGTGEGVDDLEAFDPSLFVKNIIG